MRRTIFEPEHDVYRDSVRAFLGKRVIPFYSQWENDRIVPRELFAQAGDLGAFAAVPAEFGGAGIIDYRYNAILPEEAAYAGVAPALIGLSLQSDVTLAYLLALTTGEQKARWLPGVASGETITAIAMSEPGTGSDLAGIRTRAVRDGDHYVISGTKTFITNGINADLVIVAARTAEDPHRGLSLIVVERGTPGFERGRALQKIGLHVQDTAELVFDHARVPAANLLGDEGSGFFSLTTNLPQERLSLAVAGVAGAAAALDWTVGYVKDRTAFGRKIGDLQATRFRLAELVTEVEITQTYVDRCISEHNAGTLSPVAAAKAKYWATDLQGRVVDACVQLHGGYGYMAEYPIARAFIDSRASRIYGGTNEIMKEIISKAL
ncbi:acyl-CoA dehydrogenase family protein [Amycolatopsis rubida]|uniref:Acyl-[acyl-carrier-protein] dehydrogenase MbtN n=1 Tax=Amycolatopsis rubida TaxID=112413 RepID=A0A1I5ZGV8_9PSEU|nr:acyl-CoA dehydrogenase family protein [Amycolatopsis rubida]SFQ55714.1 acyl-CoA dehydrogenase [Amycolatopsis rubida]